MNGIILRQTQRNAAPARSTVNTQDNLRICLERGRIFSLEGDNRGRTIACLRGMMWITQPGDTTDYRLAATETFTITRRGHVVIQALEESVVETGKAL